MGWRNRGKDRRKRSRLPKAELEAIYKALSKESDRGVVLVGSQMLQDRLEEVLRKLFERMADIPYTVKANEQLKGLIAELLSPDLLNAPLARSGPRIMLCRVLGLIGSHICDGITGIQRIRNHFFAHYTGHVSLSTPLVQKAVFDLYNSFPDYELDELDHYEKLWRHGRIYRSKKFSKSRFAFITMVSFLHVRIGDAYEVLFDRFIPPVPLNQNLEAADTR
jgi:hypothetical protein